MYTKGQYVRLHTNDEWNNLIGIIDKVQETPFGKLFSVFCVTMACWMYHIWEEEANSKLELLSY